jgi:hypothetical protein
LSADLAAITQAMAKASREGGNPDKMMPMGMAVGQKARSRRIDPPPASGAARSADDRRRRFLFDRNGLKFPLNE